jgi:hypothetical protein
MRRALATALAVVCVGVLASCSRDGLDAGEARLTLGEGARVLVSTPGGGTDDAEDAQRLEPGTRVRVTAGSATLLLSGGSSAEMRTDSVVELARMPTLVDGDVLVFAPKAPLSVAGAGTRVTVSGAARVSRDLAVSAASYQGQLTVESAGRSLVVPALRQAAIASLGVLPDTVRPIAYRVDDAWDRRFLGTAIALGDELESKSQGFTVSLAPGEGRTPDFFQRLIPVLGTQPGFGPPVVSAARPPGETMVGLAIALAGTRGTFSSRSSEVFAFREQGAAWGLVALDQGVTDDRALVRSLDEAIGRAPLAFVPPPPPPSPPPAPPTTRPGRRPASRPPTTAQPATAPAPAPGPPPPAPPGEAPLGPVVRPLVEILDGLLPG